MDQNSKLYIVTRKDLLPGAQASQLLHACVEFGILHPEIYQEWYRASNTIVLLSTTNENKLKRLINKAENKGIRISCFNEPDMNDELTAVAFEPGEPTSLLLKELPLAMREYNTSSSSLTTKLSPLKGNYVGLTPTWSTIKKVFKAWCERNSISK